MVRLSAFGDVAQAVRRIADSEPPMLRILLPPVVVGSGESTPCAFHVALDPVRRAIEAASSSSSTEAEAAVVMLGPAAATIQPPAVCDETLAAVDAACNLDPATTTEPVRRAVTPIAFLVAAIFRDVPAVEAELQILDPTLPVGAGLGSSAAVAVAASAALLRARHSVTTSVGHTSSEAWLTEHLDTVNRWAFAAETLFHGTPSGLDNTVATLGGVLAFRKAQRGGFPSLRPRHELDVLIINTRVCYMCVYSAERYCPYS